MSLVTLTDAERAELRRTTGATEIDTRSCDTFLWHQSTKVRCKTCGVPRGHHIGGYISQRPSDPGLTAYLSESCDECERTATHNGQSQSNGNRGKFCNSHLNWDAPAFARDD